jgi:uncharacterized protein involved in cysteine biosynthesis
VLLIIGFLIATVAGVAGAIRWDAMVGELNARGEGERINPIGWWPAKYYDVLTEYRRAFPGRATEKLGFWFGISLIGWMLLLVGAML